MRAAHADNAMNGNAIAMGLKLPVSCRKSRRDANHAREAHDWKPLSGMSGMHNSSYGFLIPLHRRFQPVKHFEPCI